MFLLNFLDNNRCAQWKCNLFSKEVWGVGIWHRVKLLAGVPISHFGVLGSWSWFTFWSGFFLMCTLGKHQWLRYLDSCCPGGRPGWSSGFTASAGPSSAAVSIWGVSPRTGELCLSLCLLFTWKKMKNQTEEKQIFNCITLRKPSIAQFA